MGQGGTLASALRQHSPLWRRPPASDRRCLDGIFFVLRTGCQTKAPLAGGKQSQPDRPGQARNQAQSARRGGRRARSRGGCRSQPQRSSWIRQLKSGRQCRRLSLGWDAFLQRGRAYGAALPARAAFAAEEWIQFGSVVFYRNLLARGAPGSACRQVPEPAATG